MRTRKIVVYKTYYHKTYEEAELARKQASMTHEYVRATEKEGDLYVYHAGDAMEPLEEFLS